MGAAGGEAARRGGVQGNQKLSKRDFYSDLTGTSYSEVRRVRKKNSVRRLIHNPIYNSYLKNDMLPIVGTLPLEKDPLAGTLPPERKIKNRFWGRFPST
jgi:hypothetical protein